MPDATLNTQNIPLGPGSVQIDGGTSVGQNLFHSFESFDIDTGDSVYFFSPADINHIFSRVTGTTPSEIDGILGTSGSDADLFLMNPNGMMFGPNASLDVQGSFIGTTANAIQFGNKVFFSATDLNNSQLLNISPSAFLFTQIIPDALIENRSLAPAGRHPSGSRLLGLRTPDRESLILLGGGIKIDGGYLNAIDGYLGLAGLSDPGAVPILEDSFGRLAINLSGISTLSDISLNNAIVTVVGGGHGDLTINADNLSVITSSITGGSTIGRTSFEYQPGDITIRATGNAYFNDSVVQNYIADSIEGHAGDVNINAESIYIKNGSVVGTRSYGIGDIGRVQLDAQNLFELSDSSYVVNNHRPRAVGNAQGIHVHADQISIESGGQIQALTYNNFVQRDDGTNRLLSSESNPGNIRIIADDIIFIGGLGDSGYYSGLFTSPYNRSLIREEKSLNSGEIEIVSNKLFLEDAILTTRAFTSLENGTSGDISIRVDQLSSSNSKISTSQYESTSNGINGDIHIHANNDFILTDSLIQTHASFLSSTDAGNVTIEADSLTSQNSRIDAYTRSYSGNGRGFGGDVYLNITDKIIATGKPRISEQNFSNQNWIYTGVGFGSAGEGGDIKIQAGSLSLTDVRINAETRTGGTSGNILLDIDNSISSANSEITSANFNGFTAGGAAGNVTVNSSSLLLEGNSEINSGNVDENQTNIGGQISIDVTDLMYLSDSKILSLSSLPSSNRTDIQNTSINIEAGHLQLTNSSQINTSVRSFASDFSNAGNIQIKAQQGILITNGSAIVSSVERRAAGRGGDIDIETSLLSLYEGGQITSSLPGEERYTSSYGSLVYSPGAQGEGGNIFVDADVIEIFGVLKERPNNRSQTFDGVNPFSGLYVSAGNGSIGPSGDITVVTDVLRLEDEGIISAANLGNGSAGNINIILRDLAYLNHGNIVTQSTSSSGGDINISASTISNGGLLILQSDSDITTNSQEAGGNITILVPVVALDDSDILARSQDDRGGNIILGPFFSETLPPDNQVPFDGDGNVDVNADGQIASGVITTPDTSFIQNSMTELPDTLVNPDTLIASSCVAHNQETGGTFIITGNSLASTPNSTSPIYSIGTVQTPNANTARSIAQSTIIEPTGIYQTTNGRLIMSQECL